MKTKKVHKKELAAVFALAGPERYSYFVRQVADWEQIWGLKDDGGWAIMGDNEGREMIAVWAHPQFAEACIGTDWKERQPTAISLDDWLSAWTPGMMRDNRFVSVMPNPSGQGVVVSPERLRDDLQEELENYE